MTDAPLPRSLGAKTTLLAACLSLSAAGCGTRHLIIAGTGTNIGVEIAQDPVSQFPTAKLGYQRGEVAMVPTNRSAEKEPGSTGAGAAQHGDVIMELRYGGIFDTGPSSGIYQRLAVGKGAVSQPGAAFMFARDANGNLDGAAAQALQSALTVPATPPEVTDLKAQIAAKSRCDLARVNEEVARIGGKPWADYDAFRDADPREPTAAEAKRILDALADVTCAAAAVPTE